MSCKVYAYIEESDMCITLGCECCKEECEFWKED